MTTFVRFIFHACFRFNAIFAALILNVILSATSANLYSALGWSVAVMAFGLFCVEKALRKEWEQIAVNWREVEKLRRENDKLRNEL